MLAMCYEFEDRGGDDGCGDLGEQELLGVWSSEEIRLAESRMRLDVVALRDVRL